jgi:hypothetical protein
MITFEFSNIKLIFNEVSDGVGDKAYTPADRATWIQCMLQSSNGVLLAKTPEHWPSIESMVLGYSRVEKIAKLIAFSISSHGKKILIS